MVDPGTAIGAASLAIQLLDGVVKGLEPISQALSNDDLSYGLPADWVKAIRCS